MNCNSIQSFDISLVIRKSVSNKTRCISDVVNEPCTNNKHEPLSQTIPHVIMAQFYQNPVLSWLNSVPHSTQFSQTPSESDTLPRYLRWKRTSSMPPVTPPVEPVSKDGGEEVKRSIRPPTAHHCPDSSSSI